MASPEFIRAIQGWFAVLDEDRKAREYFYLRWIRLPLYKRIWHALRATLPESH